MKDKIANIIYDCIDESYRTTNKDEQQIASDILAIPEMVELLEKAAKWDKYCRDARNALEGKEEGPE